MEYKSEDIIDIKKISQLLESYTKATGLETALLDLDGNILIQSGWQKICTKFHRKNSETAQNCLKSDTILAEKIKTGSEYNIYKCLNGLINVAVPIIVNNTHLYNLFTGQLFFETPDEASFIAQADKYKFNKKEYLSALKQVPILKESDLKNKLLFLSQMTEVIVELGLEKYKRTKTNIKLNESEEKFRALFNNSPLSYQSLNKDGNYIDINPAWLKMLGYKKEEVINHSFFDFLHPESAQKAKYDLFPNFKNCGFIKNIEFKIRHKTGHYIDIAFEGCIGYNPDGSFKQTYCMFTDITKRKLADQLILKNKYRLEYALNSIETGAWELDLETLESWRTIKHDQIFGHQQPLKEWTYEMFLEHVIPEDRDVVDQKFQHALTTKTDWNFECRIKRYNDGKICWIWANGNQELNEQNESKKMFGIVQDITERKQAAKRLQESNELFRITFNQQFQFMSVLSPDGRIIEINDLPLMVQGGKREEVIGKVFWELNTWQNNQEWQAKVKKQILDAATMKETLLTEDSFITNDGDIHTALATYTAIRDEKNNVRYILVQATDITKRKQAENEVKNQAAKWQATFNAMSDSVSIIDLDGNISQNNTATLSMFNINEKDLKEKKCFDLVHGTQGFINDCPLVRMKKSHQAESMTFKKEGRWLEVNVDPIFNAKNELTGAVHVVSDITKRKITEEALQINENKLNIIIDTSPIGICTVDEQGNFITTNQAYEQILGYTKEELIGLSFYDVTHPNDRPKNKEVFQNLFSVERTNFSLEKKYIHKNGKELIVSVHTVGSKNTNGDNKYATAFVENITDRKVAEEAIYLSNERYKILFNNSPIPLWEEDLTEIVSYLVKLKEKGHKNLANYLDDNPKELMKFAKMINILDVNQAALNLHQAKNKKQLIENLSGTFTNKSFTVFKNELIALFEGKETFKSESEVKTLSGDLKYIHITLKIDKSQPDKIKALLATPDITKQKQTEAKLRESEYNLKSTFDISPSIISKADMNIGRFIQVNKAVNKILGYSVDEFTSKPYMEFVHPDDRQRTIDEGKKQQQGGKVVFFENRYLCKDGSYKWMAWYATKANKNGISTAIGIDVHERKLAEKELTKHRENLEYLVKERTQELETKNKELARFNDLFVDREFRIKELKNEIDKLKNR